MEFWTPVSLTVSKRPTLLANEVITRVQSNVGLYDGETRLSGIMERGTAMVTTHRILWIHDPEIASKVSESFNNPRETAESPNETNVGSINDLNSPEKRVTMQSTSLAMDLEKIRNLEYFVCCKQFSYYFMQCKPILWILLTTTKAQD
jgi:hypothetical protein